MTFAAGGIILDGKKMLLIQRSKNMDHRPGTWGVPAGKTEPGESPEQTAAREVKEEVGLDFTPTTLFKERQGTRFYNYLFLGTWSGEVNVQIEEVDDYAWCDYEEAKKHFTRKSHKELLEKLREEGLL